MRTLVHINLILIISFFKQIDHKFFERYNIYHLKIKKIHKKMYDYQVKKIC